MTEPDLLQALARGKYSRQQFKRDAIQDLMRYE